MSHSWNAVAVEDVLRQCEEVLQYRFQDRELLERCLTHSSVAKTRLHSNERLEFLGDAILGAVVCEMLYHQFPDAAEGELTRIKSAVVSRSTCAAITRALGLRLSGSNCDEYVAPSIRQYIRWAGLEAVRSEEATDA